MAYSSTPLEQLKSFLNQLFQFDSQDLDFGVYKILHFKKKEIATFIDQLLVDKVKAELQTLSADEAKQVQTQIAEMEKSTSLKKWLEAVEKNDEARLVIYEEDYKDEIEQYKELKKKAIDSSVSVETENQIYNHLSLFFSRYYDKGDFISKRRFGKNEKYVVPYNGEETHFHWANQDQYYIKSSETFNHYAFKLQAYDCNLVINFKLHNAQLEQGNVKADEPNFFLLADVTPEIKEVTDSEPNFVLANKQPDVSAKEVTIYFEYRPLAEDEKKKVKGNNKQDNLDEIAFDFLKKEFGTNPTFANLWKEQDGKPLLLKKLQHYTRKNKHDFFIHKNLKGFLDRELDYYIKSELVKVDDLYITDTDSHFDRLRHNLKTIKVFKSIADTIIEFVSQIEEFQKKLWEKKKFVLSTDWVITIDRLVEYIGEEAAIPILEEVIRNEKQVAEWQELFLGKNETDIVVDTLKEDLHSWKRLPIDTSFFEDNFKNYLLNRLSEKITLNKELSGLLLNSDNYHALKTLEESYIELVNVIYIDPPFNLGTNPDYAYKVDYKDSTWLSMLEPRLIQAKELINSASGSIFLRCNHDGNFLVRSLMNKVFGKENFRNEIILRRAELSKGDLNKQFTSLKSITVNYDNIYWYSKNSETRFDRFLRKTSTEQGKSHWHSFWKAENRPNLRYEIKGIELERGQWMWKKERAFQAISNYERYLIEFDKTGISLDDYWIKIGKNEEYVWKFGDRDTISSIKYWIPPREFVMADNNWLDIKGYANGWKFKTENSEVALKRILEAQTSINDIVLDFFLGSGTTAATSEKMRRKYIGIEAGNHFYNIVLTRMKQVLYGEKSGISKETKHKGSGFFKYQRLEQYEEALENIAFNASEDTIQKALEFEQYIPKYFLEFETKGSQTLVNTAAMKDPWGYKLKVWDGFTYDTEQAVDLVETFNYLIGLHMQKCITKELNDKKYQFIYGQNNINKNILVVWRSVKDWSVDDFKVDAATLKTELKAFAYDLLYINDQAHIEGYQPIEEVFKNKMLS